MVEGFLDTKSTVYRDTDSYRDRMQQPEHSESTAKDQRATAMVAYSC